MIEPANHTDSQTQFDWEFPEVNVTIIRPALSSFEEDNLDNFYDAVNRGEEELDEEYDEDVIEEEEYEFFNQTEFTNDTIEDAISRGKRGRDSFFLVLLLSPCCLVIVVLILTTVLIVFSSSSMSFGLVLTL